MIPEMRANPFVRYSRAITNYALAGFILVLLASFLLYPIYLTIRGGFAEDPATGHGFTFRHVRAVFSDPTLVGGLLNSLKIAALTTTTATLLALPLAVLSAGYKFPGKGFFNAAVLVPMILPPFVGAIGVRALLGREGALNALLGTHFDFLGEAKLAGVVMLQALSLYPIIYLNATASLANLDPALDESAENLGAGWWRRFFADHPPAGAAGALRGRDDRLHLVVHRAGHAADVRLLPGHARADLQRPEGSRELGQALRPDVVLLTAAILLLYVLGKVLFGQGTYAMYSKAVRPGRRREALTGVWAGSAAGGSSPRSRSWRSCPHFGVILTSLCVPGQWYDRAPPRSRATTYTRR
jgi:iron(III) transport system permease protein